VPPTQSFILPGSSRFIAALHHARAICRRAERHSWHLTDASDDLRRCLNRLSDLLFILARAHEPNPEPLWQPVQGDAAWISEGTTAHCGMSDPGLARMSTCTRSAGHRGDW
jgi:hypothetical protein